MADLRLCAPPRRARNGHTIWLFAGTLAAGQRAAVITTLIQTAKLNGHDPYAYLKDILQRLPTQRASPSASCCRIAGRPPQPD